MNHTFLKGTVTEEFLEHSFRSCGGDCTICVIYVWEMWAWTP